MRRLLLELANYLYYLSIFVFPIKKNSYIMVYVHCVDKRIMLNCFKTYRSIHVYLIHSMDIYVFCVVYIVNS